MIFYSPAKINIGLQVLKKRSDGFHDIATYMLPIPFFDIIELTEDQGMDESFSLLTTGIDLKIKKEDNLLTKTYQIFPVNDQPHKLSVHLHKQIPAGSGLGGGSSNAATLLKALNNFTGNTLDSERLKKIASGLGSDCAVFIDNKPCIAKGRGEILTPLDLNLGGNHLVLLNPGIEINTAEAYRGIAPKNDRPSLESLISQPISNWKELIENDFESGVFKMYPDIEALKNALYDSGAIYASMSGSGSSVYGIFKNKPQIKQGLNTHLLWEGAISGV